MERIYSHCRAANFFTILAMPFLKRFPVQVALAALAVYGMTLAHGVTLPGLLLTAQVADWGGQSTTSQPLFWLLTLPFRLLPAGWIPLALNAFSAVCAALTLGFLAATLELAAWDRPLAELSGWRSRLPLLLGVVLCGLEFNFWQAATQATGEALQILLLASALWCLFRYRVARDFVWLKIAAGLWGVGMAENWMMLLTLPLFIGALLWQGKWRLLQWRLLISLAGAGLAGFALFAVLPTVNGLWPGSPTGLGEAWWLALKKIRMVVVNGYWGFWRGHRLASLAMLVHFLVPVLPALIRMPDRGTKNISPLDRYQVWFYRLLRAGLLLMCLWLALDPVFGLRQILQTQLGMSVPLLSLDYLTGLGAGFLAGNLLLALRGQPTPGRRRQSLGSKVAVPAFVTLLVLVLAGLMLRNASAITLPNRQPFTQFGRLALSHLPPGGGILMADEPLRLLSFEAALAGYSSAGDWMTVDTTGLVRPEYQHWLVRRHPEQWPDSRKTDQNQTAEVGRRLDELAQSNRVYYLHSSFGTFFETFYPIPTGLAQELKKYVSRSIHPPELTAENLAKNEALWDAMGPDLEALRQTVAAAEPGAAGRGRFMETRLYLKPMPPVQSRLLAEWYAMALDDWAVQLQRAGQLPAARKRFEQALGLNKNNTAVNLNLQVNARLLAGDPLNFADIKTLAAKLGDAKQASRFLQAFGPVDAPAFCYLMANCYIGAGLIRQALQQFDRAATLVPTNPIPQVPMAALYARAGFESKARDLLAQVRGELSADFRKTNYLDADLYLIEAGMAWSKSNFSAADQTLEALGKEYPGDARVADRLLQTYLNFGDVTNALRLLEPQLARTPNDPGALNLQGALLLQSGRANDALAVLDRALTLTNLPVLQLTHARAQLAADHLAEAESELRTLERLNLNPALIHFELATLAERRHNLPQAVQYLQICLTNAPPGSPLWQQARTRLRSLQP